MKKIISIILSVVLVLCAVAVPASVAALSPRIYILGDADGNGDVDAVDATFIQRYCAEIAVSISYYTLMNGDVDQSGELEVTDATFIQRYLAEMTIPYAVGQETYTDPIKTPTISVSSVTASAGETVGVAVNVRNNPGILGMTLTLSYNSRVLTLTNAVSGDAVSNVLTFTKPGRFTSPCNFTWDGIELSDNQIKDGEILILTFRVASNAQNGTYPITLSYEEDSIIDKNLVPVSPDIVYGSVIVNNTAVNPTVPNTEPPTEAPVTGAAFIVDNVTAAKGGTVGVAVNIRDNPGILGMTLTLSYDSSKLTLTNAVSGSAVNDVLSFTKPGRFTSPCNFTWDGIELSSEQIKDGEILVLTFSVANNASGNYPITISYEEDSVISANLKPINVAVINGSITVR